MRTARTLRGRTPFRTARGGTEIGRDRRLAISIINRAGADARTCRDSPSSNRRPSGRVTGSDSPPDLAVAVDDPLGAGQLAEAAGAAGVELVGADADLGAQAELAAVVEP